VRDDDRRERGMTTGVVIIEVPPDHSVDAPAAKKRKKPAWRALEILVALAIVVACFAYAIPKLASYSDVWTAITHMTPTQIGILLAVTAFNLLTYWWQNMASLPGLKLGPAAVNNQTSTSVANTMPGGGAVAVAVSYEMYRSWGFSGSDIGLSYTVTTLWNIFAKLAFPAIALVIILLTGGGSRALVTASLIGLLVLAAACVVFALVLWKKRFARAIGTALGHAASWASALIRRPRAFEWGEFGVRFRRKTINLIVRRWFPLTVTTIVSHVTLYLVLLLSLRFAGVTEAEVSWAQVLGVFAIGRLLTALPLTPGGVGIVEVAYIGGLILAGRDHATVSPEVFHAQVAAGVLTFRALTYGVQIPLGVFTYLFYRTNKSWRRPPASADPVVIPSA
jgi:putative heme transporter